MKWFRSRSRSKASYEVNASAAIPLHPDTVSLREGSMHCPSPSSMPRTPRERKYLRRVRAASLSALSTVSFDVEGCGVLRRDRSFEDFECRKQMDSSFEDIGSEHCVLLSPSFGDIDDREPAMDDVHEHVYEKDQHKVEELIGHLAETEGAKAIEKAVHEVPAAVDELARQVVETADLIEIPTTEAARQPEQQPPPLHAVDVLYDSIADVEKPSTLLPEPIREVLVDSPLSPADSGRDTVSRLLGDHSDDEDDAPIFGRQTPEEDTFERDGPLRIPIELIEQPEPEREEEQEDAAFEPLPVIHHDHHGFETVARPPTPPKDISEEDCKPSTVHLGHHAEPHRDTHRSILKHTGVEPAFPSSSEPWFDFRTIDPRMLDLVYWRDPKHSGIVLGAILSVLFIFTRFPLITVLSYSGLAVLTGTVGFRVLKTVEAQIKKTDSANPFQPYLEQDLTIPADKVREQVDVIVEHTQCLGRQLRRLFLVEDIVDSVKFGLLLWSFTYIGAWFSGSTIIFLIVVAVFSLPKIYETYQEPIDAQLAVVKGHIDKVTAILEEKLPFLKKAAVEAEKKDQ